MAFDTIHSKEIDLDRTDKLPILQGFSVDDDVLDDAEPLEYDASAGVMVASLPGGADISRQSALDLPSLAESVRSVEERIARQNADYEALSRLYEKARDAQAVAGTRADTLAAELAAAHSALAVEQQRFNEMQRAVADANAAAESTRARVEEALRDSERAQTEARTLRDSLVARDATIAQVLHSLGERDAQLSALQREHAKIVPALELRSQTSARLEAELKAARDQAQALSVDLAASRQSVAELETRLSRGEAELNEARRELRAAKAQAETYLETLRSREWRSGFNQNLFREWDERVDAAQVGQGALQAECDRLNLIAAAMNSKLVEQDEIIAKLKASKAGDAAALATRSQEIQEAQRTRAELAARIETLEAERKRAEGEITARTQELIEARAHGAAESQRLKDLQASSDARHAELTAQIEQLKADASTHEEEMTVLMAHLTEARRPIMAVQADFKRLNDDIAQRASIIDRLTEENRGLRAALERTRGALEERDLLIRRLERNASTNANVLGRLQTSIARLGTPAVSAPAPAPAPVSAPDYSAELVRLNGEQLVSFPLGRRTRIGRAPGCELQIDAGSVSRNHAVVLKGARELIVEDLNSTNGVQVNGKKVSRHLLSDGDVLTIGEIQFRCVVRPGARPGDGSSDAARTGGAHAALAAAHPALAAGGAHGALAASGVHATLAASGTHAALAVVPPSNVADLRRVETSRAETQSIGQG
jgi:chromosome segregation ATPase